jgi:colanic acid biosynthesis protein WcaH
MPIVCVDGVLINEDKKVLFLKRDNEPAKNEWWFPGGRVIKNELMEYSIIRKFKEETNLDVSVVKFIGVTETIFETGPFNIPVHTINFTYLLSSHDKNIKIDNLHSDYIWENDFDKLNLNPEIYKILKNNL